MTKAAEQIVAEIKSLTEDALVESNDGTHSKDPQFFTWRTYEKLDGTRYTVGAKGEGYTRHHKFESATARRARIASLRILLQKTHTEAHTRDTHIASLNRGWDGYQFVGVTEGQRRVSLIS